MGPCLLTAAFSFHLPAWLPGAGGLTAVLLALLLPAGMEGTPMTDGRSKMLVAYHEVRTCYINLPQ